MALVGMAVLIIRLKQAVLAEAEPMEIIQAPQARQIKVQAVEIPQTRFIMPLQAAAVLARQVKPRQVIMRVEMAVPEKADSLLVPPASLTMPANSKSVCALLKLSTLTTVALAAAAGSGATATTTVNAVAAKEAESFISNDLEDC